MRYFELTESKITFPGYQVDNPGGRWLEQKKQEVLKHGTRGSMTASFGLLSPAKIKVSFIKDLPGENNEHTFRHNSLKLADLRQEVSNHGWKPTAIMIWVNMFGRPTIAEGNHRVQLASELGIEWIPADIRYWTGGEEAGGEFDPQFLISKGIIKPA